MKGAPDSVSLVYLFYASLQRILSGNYTDDKVLNSMSLLTQVQQTNIDDEAVARSIALKLGDTPGVSYSEIANKAIECGRTQLAVRVSDLVLLLYKSKMACCTVTMFNSFAQFSNRKYIMAN